MTRLFFLIVFGLVIFGIMVFIYLRQEQSKVILKNKQDEEVEIEFYKKRNSLTSVIFGKRVFLFLGTFGAALFLTLLSISIFRKDGEDAVSLIFCFPFSLIAFPSGLIPIFNQPIKEPSFVSVPIAIGWFIYAAIFLIGVKAKNRLVFKFIYLTFIMLLLMNIIGCTRNAYLIDLSNIN